MKQKAKNIYAVLKREVRLISKDVNLISILLLAPIFYSFFYGSIYINKVESDVKVTVVDMDRSNTSQKLIRMFDAHQLIAVENVVGDYSRGRSEVESGDVQGMIFIPKNFEADLKSELGTDLKIYLNTTRFLVSNDINKSVNDVIATLSAGMRLKYFEVHGFSYNQAKEMIEPLRTDMRPMFNSIEGYGDFLIPSILILIIHQTLLIGLSESVSKERETNKLHELYDRSNQSTFAAIHGKGLFYAILFSAYTLFFFTINFTVFKIAQRGSASALALLTVLMIVAVIYFSFFISSFFKRKITALQFLTLTSYPIFLISGYSWPLEAMPFPLQAISNLIPLTPYLNAFARITQMGAGWNEVMPQIIHISVLILVVSTATFFRMNKLFTAKTQLTTNHGD